MAERTRQPCLYAQLIEGNPPRSTLEITVPLTEIEAEAIRRASQFSMIVAQSVAFGILLARNVTAEHVVERAVVRGEG